MKLFTFNIRQGGGKRIDRIISAINKADADINVICEYRKGKNGEHLKSKLSEAGYDICVNPDVERNKNTVAIFSRLSFRYQRIDYDLGVYNIRAKQIEANGLTILGVHFPNRGKKKTMFEFLIDYVDKNKNKDLIIMGDFNTGNNDLDCGDYRFRFADRFDEVTKLYGWHDVWRHKNGNKREYSRYSNTGNGFRIDHIFCTKSFIDKVRDIKYLHNLREEGISDHSGLLLDIDV